MRLIPSSRRPMPPLLLLGITGLSSASPFPKDNLHDIGYSFLMPRGCGSYCGTDNQLCCGSDQVCTTVQGDIATCVAGGGGGGGGGITTTWTETRTYTSTIMTNWDPVPQPTEGVDCVPKNDQQEACGPICCAGWQTCAFHGQCSAKPGYQEPSTVVITTGGKTTTQYSAPYRITGTTTVVGSGAPTNTDATATGTDGSPAEATETDGGGAVGSGDSGKGGLSGGEIAGIVIGSLAGVALISLIAFCCIARGLWNVLFGRKKKEERDDYDERYSGRGSRTPSGYGRQSRYDAGSEKKSSGKKWLGLAGLAATLLALLNFKKDKKPARKPARSRYSNSYYSYSDASPSSSSSGGRTHRTRRSEYSRGPPRSYYSKTSRSRRS